MAPQKANLRRLAANLQARGISIAEEITERIRKELVEVRAVDDEEFLRTVHESSLANIAAALAIVGEGRRLPRTPPADVGEAARAAANSGISLATLLRAYRIAHAVCWREWMRETEALDLPSRERQALLETGSDFIFEYVDHIATLVTEDYTRERDAFVRSIEQRQVRLVRDLIDGVSNDASDLEYDLGLEHIGIVAWGADADVAVRQLARQLERRLLTVEAGGDAIWAWLGSRTSLREPERRILRKLEPRGRTRLAFGDPAVGIGGFRQTHREARDAQRVGVRLGRDVTHYDDVALEALAVRDERYARAFVARELHPLGGDDERARRLRETLRAYFAAGQNASAAAAILGVHDQTVAYRLRTIEERLGRPVHARRAELEAALRLEAVLGEARKDGSAAPSPSAKEPEIRLARS